MGGNHSGAGHQAANLARGHQEQLVAGETDHLRFDLLAVGAIDQATSAHGCLTAHGLQGHADHAVEGTFDDEIAGTGHSFAGAHQRAGPALYPRAACFRLIHGATVRGPEGWRSVPKSSLKMVPSRVSSRASMREVALVIWQPPRAITGSSTMTQARSFSVGAKCSRTTVASSGCKCTRISRVATG